MNWLSCDFFVVMPFYKTVFFFFFAHIHFLISTLMVCRLLVVIVSFQVLRSAQVLYAAQNFENGMERDYGMI